MDGRWFVYIATNHKNNVLYTGTTNNLQRRIEEHRLYKADSFTKRYKVYKLVWYEDFPSPQEAIRAEKMVKGWSRSKKMNLITKSNPSFDNLFCAA